MNPYQDLYVWLFSSSAVIVISLCGLLSVAIIPLMQKWFYHTMLQLLVGLAIGSLTADGLLHLMPHAILGGVGDHNDHEHSVSVESLEKTAIYRSLTTLGGIFTFFIVERLLGILTSCRRQMKEIKRQDITNKTDVNGELTQLNKSSYHHVAEGDGKEDVQMLGTEPTPSRKTTVQGNHEVAFHGRSNFRIENDSGVLFHPNSDSCMIVSDHHGHSHGHSHDIPNSISSVAWMVIMGDGLHNFCDGLAIGAAFASSPADGISTSLAVFCHELPHELGDFAMLLKTGMTVKQALCYNGLSSILCFTGMIIGIFLGNINSAVSWVFAFTAGMFLYIALVDMLPELTSGSNKSSLEVKNPIQTAINILIVQLIGISTGICIMLLIALHEKSLSSFFS